MFELTSRNFQVCCIVDLKPKTSVYYCVLVKQLMRLATIVAHSCPVCDMCSSQTASKMLYSSTNKHESMTNFLPPSMLNLRFEVLHESYLYCCIVHGKQIIMNLANDSYHFCFPLQHLPQAYI